MDAIDRKMKYMKRSNDNELININFDLSTLELMSAFVISENKNIRKSSLINMKNLFESINTKIYENDPIRKKHVNFIKKGLQARLVENLNNPSIIEKYVNGGIVNDNQNRDDMVRISELKPLNNAEIDFINKQVSTSLKNSYFFNDIDKLEELIIRFKSGDFSNNEQIVNDFEDEIVRLAALFRHARVENQQEITFSLRDSVFNNVFTDIHEELTNPSHRLFTGMKGFNKLIGGAFETGRVYMLLGLAAAGKSMILLNLAKQIKEFNKGYRTKDPTKTPCVIILTMENTVQETVDRLYQITTSEDMKQIEDVNVAMDKFRSNGMTITKESPIDIMVKYVPNRTVTTEFLYTLYEELEEDGYEMICCIQDHVKRIKSNERTSDLRIELGNIVNEFKNFAIAKDVVVITNSHLNRDAASKVEDGKNSNRQDIINILGKQNIGESLLMIDNLDMAIIINRETDRATDTEYMGFKRIKERVKVDPNFVKMYQPFADGSIAKLQTDVDIGSILCKESLACDAPMNTGANNAIAQQNARLMEFNNQPNDELNLFMSESEIPSTKKVNKKKNEKRRVPKLIYGRREDRRVV